MIVVYQDLPEFLGQWDPQDPKENLVFLEDLVVQVRWDKKEREGTL